MKYGNVPSEKNSIFLVMGKFSVIAINLDGYFCLRYELILMPLIRIDNPYKKNRKNIRLNNVSIFIFIWQPNAHKPATIWQREGTARPHLPQTRWPCFSRSHHRTVIVSFVVQHPTWSSSASFTESV